MNNILIHDLKGFIIVFKYTNANLFCEWIADCQIETKIDLSFFNLGGIVNKWELVFESSRGF
jgi:hypothetical protein